MLKAVLVPDTPVGPEAEVGVMWLTLARLAPEDVDGEVLPLPWIWRVTTGSVTTTAPRPFTLTALTRIEGLTIPTWKPSM